MAKGTGGWKRILGGGCVDIAAFRHSGVGDEAATGSMVARYNVFCQIQDLSASWSPHSRILVRARLIEIPVCHPDSRRLIHAKCLQNADLAFT